ncbi:hypothetical protein FACS1894184_14810 [Clostridia bacterium]|nr:hypothetical protein FACS1894184_14810 [Clostridia bacterium]
MKISINCPSYKRPKVETLKYLPFCKVWVCETEAEEYRKANPHANIVECTKGIQGNLCRIRNHILKTEFDNGYDVVLIIDDDMSEVSYFEEENGFAYNNKVVKTDDFIEFIFKHSIMAMDIGAYLWGININQDKQPYKLYTPISTVSYIGGPFQCFIKGNDCFYDETLPLKEDYDMTLQQLNKHRVVLRFNKFHYICKQAKQKGGCAAYRTHDEEQKQLDLLIKKWGSDIVKRDKQDRNHKLVKVKTNKDFNPVIRVPIKGV